MPSGSSKHLQAETTSAVTFRKSSMEQRLDLRKMTSIVSLLVEHQIARPLDSALAVRCGIVPTTRVAERALDEVRGLHGFLCELVVAHVFVVGQGGCRDAVREVVQADCRQDVVFPFRR